MASLRERIVIVQGKERIVLAPVRERIVIVLR